MSNFDWAFAGEAFYIRWIAPFQTTGLFPRARIINSSGSLVTTVSLTANATITYLYSGSWTPPNEGQFTVVIDVYTDSGFTTLHESFDGTTVDLRVKEVGGGFRGGALGGKEVKKPLTEEEVDRIARAVWQLKIGSGVSAEATLTAKSEFNPETDSVKTESMMTEINTDGLEGRLLHKLEAMESTMAESLKSLDSKDSILELGKLLGKQKNELFTTVEQLKGGVLALSAEQKGDLGVVMNGVIARLESLERVLEDRLASLEFATPEMVYAVEERLEELHSAMPREMAALGELCKKILAEIVVNEKMLEALDNKESQRFRRLLSVLGQAAGEILMSNKLYAFKNAGRDRLEDI